MPEYGNSHPSKRRQSHFGCVVYPDLSSFEKGRTGCPAQKTLEEHERNVVEVPHKFGQAKEAGLGHRAERTETDIYVLLVIVIEVRIKD